ncbi:C2 domain-containing protein [Wolffia australiana]
MARKRAKELNGGEIAEFLVNITREKPLLPLMVPMVVVLWLAERWIAPFSNWVPLVVAIWTTIQYERFQRRQIIEDINHKWQQLVTSTSPTTPNEPCEWLNKLVIDIWPNFLDPKISRTISSIVAKRLKYKKPPFLEKIELQEFSLGSSPPTLGAHGVHWYTSGEQRILKMGFDWKTSDMSVMLLAKLAPPLMGTAKIVVNNLQIKGKVLLMPVLEGQAILFSFESPPELRVGVAFGSGGSQSLPATELPGVSSWLEKVFAETLGKKLVEPRRGCFTLPPVNLKKRPSEGLLSVTVLSARNLLSADNDSHPSNLALDRSLQTFVEVVTEDLSRRTSVKRGTRPVWEETFNMVLRTQSEAIKFNLYQWRENGVKFDFLASLEIMVRYAEDDSTIFWAIGPDSCALAKRAPYDGKEVEMVVPFEESNAGELSVKLVLREWHESDGSSSSLALSSIPSQPSISGSNFQPGTGRKLKVTIVEGKDLLTKSSKSDAYVKLRYGKTLRKTKTIAQGSGPKWNQTFEFDEIGGGEYLRVNCYNADVFGDDHVGSARVNLEGLVEGSVRDVWIPLEKVNRGELRLQIQAQKKEDLDGSSSLGRRKEVGLIELSIIEARDLVGADLRGTSDPYVRVHYGGLKRRTKVIHKTVNPRWDQTLEFPDTGSSLVLHVKDYNALLPTSNIGHCTVEYENLAPNVMADKWIPLQGVTKGEIHIQIARKVPELEKKLSTDPTKSLSKGALEISLQSSELLKKIQSSVKEGEIDDLPQTLAELERAKLEQDGYMSQLETERALLLEKIAELYREMNDSSPSSAFAE